MGLIEKIKLLFKIRQPATDIITEVKSVKTGYKTWQFWVTLTGSLLAIVGATQGLIPAVPALIITTVLTSLYQIFRGAAKADVQGTKPVVQTTEFWLGVLSTISNAILTLKGGGVNYAWFVTAQTLLSSAMAAGQNLAGQAPGSGATVALATTATSNTPSTAPAAK